MRISAFVVGLLFALTGLAVAQPYETPEALLRAFYEPYFSGDFSADDSQFRSRALEALYENDMALAGEGEMGAISFDPYIDGQDFDITDLAIATPDIAGDQARVDVTFRNFGEPRTLTYELVLEDGGWQIDDVVSTNPHNRYRLTEIFAEAEAGY
mgnify:CR=1 FL=1